MEQKVPWEGVSEAAKREGLYEEHEIIEELVIGPEVLQPPDVAFTLLTTKLKLSKRRCSNSSFVIKPKAMWANRENFQDIQNSVSTDTCQKQLVDKELHSIKTIQEEIMSKVDMCNKEVSSNTGGESLQNQSSQKQHSTRLKQTHLEKKDYTCAICDEKYTEMNDLNSHMKNHSRQQSFRCDICKKEFATYKTLRNHKQLHGGDTPYSCDVCAKQFSHKSYLNSHKRIHLINKSHHCDVCGKQFFYKYQLNTHKQIHVIEKPYSCKNCKKQFTTNQNFIKHIWICTK